MSDVAACRALGSLRAALVRAAVASTGTVLVVVAFLGRYGWDRDELYFLSASKRPTWGYVDFPPLTAWLAWGVRQLAGDSLVALRLTCLAAGVGTTFFVVLIARELGGGRFGQLAAGFAWSLSPYVLGSASIFHPTWLDALAWSAVVYLATRILVRPEPRLWPLLGVVAGIGLEAKYTMAFLLAGLGLALLLFDRRLLRTRGPWIALAIAVALLVPNLVWQAQHGWPSVEFASSQNAKSAADTPPPTYVIEQVLFLAGVLILSVIGVVWLWRQRLRVLAALPVILFLVFLVERGRAYYAMPAYVVAVAAGGVALERARRRRRWVALIAVFQVAVCVVAVPAIVPVLPERLLISTGEWKVGFFKDEIGWPELTHQTEAVWSSLPAAERAERCRPRRQLRRGGSARTLRPPGVAARAERPSELAVLATSTAPAALPRDRRCRSGNARLAVQQLAGQSHDRQPRPPRQRRATAARSTPAPFANRSAPTGPRSPATPSDQDRGASCALAPERSAGGTLLAIALPGECSEACLRLDAA